MEEESRQHLLAFDSGFMSRNALLLAMRERDPGFIAVLTNCCSNFIPSGHSRPMAAGGSGRSARFGEGPRYPPEVCRNIENLFLEHRGIVDLTAAEPGTFAFSSAGGGCFTLGLLGSCKLDRRVLDANNDGFVNWSEVWPQIRAQTNAIYTAHRTPDQEDQLAHAFQLPGEREEEVSPPVHPPEVATALITIHNNTGRRIVYTLQWGDGTPTRHAVEPGSGLIHSIRVTDGRAPSAVLTCRPNRGEGEMAFSLDSFLVEGVAVPTVEQSTQYQFLYDEVEDRIELFTD
jgi:hypothetical protein